MQMPFAQRLYILLAILAVIPIAYGLWCLRPRSMKVAPKKPSTPAPRKACSLKEARSYAKSLRTIASFEERRAWQDDSLSSRQAAWLMAKANYAVTQSKVLADPKAMTDADKNLLEDTYLMLLRACHQSRQGVVDIQEEGNARLRAFISPIDQTFQTYSLSIPAAYDPAVPWPLIVSMHGHGWFRPFQGHPAPVYSGAFCLSPQGRGATDYKDLGEVDVLAAIDEVMRDYRIDPNRIFLTGSSMGGTGAFHLATRYADRFAAIFPIVGNADNQAWTRRWGWNRRFPGRFDDLRLAVQESHTARAYAANLINLPTYILAGAGDVVVPPEHSRNMANILRSHGANMEYREYPGVGHGGFPKPALDDGLAWTCSWIRRQFPQRVFWQASQLRHGKAYWVRFEQLDQPLRPGTVDARAEANNRMTVATDNLLALSLLRPYTLFTPGQPVHLTIDGVNLVLAADRPWNSWITLRKDPIHGWNLESTLPRPPRMKQRGCEGPIQDALLDPFLLVVGTQATDFVMREAWLREAKTFAAEWKRRNGGSCRMILDTQCTQDMMKHYNLILWGGSDDNLVSRQLLPEIPLTDIMAPLRADNVDLGAEDLGSMIAYPNVTCAPERLAVIISANSPRAAFQAWGRFGNWFNWGVYDSKKYFDYAVFDARSAIPETMLLFGWFGADWQVETGKWFRGDAELRRDAIPQGFPPLTAAPSGVNSLLLTELMPSRIDQMRGALGFDRGFFGEPLPLSDSQPGGIGMRAPCTIEYNLNQQFAQITAIAAITNPPESDMCLLRQRGEAIRFTVFGDNRKLAEATVNWKTAAMPLAADLAGVTKLRLEATPAGGPAWLHIGSAWIAPTLWRNPPCPPAEWVKQQTSQNASPTTPVD